MSKLTITRQLHVHCLSSLPLSAESTLVYTSSPLQSNLYIHLGTVTLQLTVDTADVTSAQIEQLQEQIKGERALSQNRLTQLQSTINQLTAIEA